jgi:hypothetical protein
MPLCRRRALWLLAISPLFLAGSWLGSHVWQIDDHLAGFLAGLGIGGLFAAVLLWFSPDMSDAVPKKLIRRYQREISVSMGIYVMVMLFWQRLLHAVDATWIKVLIALFPAALVCFVLRAFVRYVRDSDEMQRRIELESVAIATMLVAASYLGAGFLQSAKLIDVPAGPALIMMFPALCLAYGITKIFVVRRYQ